MSSGMHIKREPVPSRHPDLYLSYTQKVIDDAGSDGMGPRARNPRINWAWVFGDIIRQEFGSEPVTLKRLVDDVLQGRGYSYMEAKEWLKDALTFGYVDRVRIRR